LIPFVVTVYNKFLKKHPFTEGKMRRILTWPNACDGFWCRYGVEIFSISSHGNKKI